MAMVEATTPMMAEKKKRKKVSRHAGLNQEELEEAARLHGLLFGTLGDVAEGLGKEHLPAFGDGEDFRRDVLGSTEDKSSAGALVEWEGLQVKKPAWEDEEDAEINVKLPKVGSLKSLRRAKDEDKVSGPEYVSRLRAHHVKLNPGTDWAELPSERKRRRNFGSDSEGEDDEYDGILRENDELVVSSKTRLPEGIVDVSKMRDANAEEPSNAVVRSVQFHKNAQILMTAGFDKTLRFFQIDGKRNPKVQSIFIEDFPIQKAQFVPDGSKVVATARRKVYVVYDLVQGKVETIMPLIGRDEKSLEQFEVSPDNKIVAFMGNDGYILLTSLGVKQLVGTLKMNGTVRSLGFTNDGRQLLSCGGDGEVYCWDLRMRRCIYKARDEGCVRNTALRVSLDNDYFATGSDSGVVNVYKREDFLGGVTKPAKSLMNLTTSIDNIRFNHDSQILAMCSKMKKNAVRLVHLPSFTVFSNWPTPKTPLHYVHSLDFSPGSGYLAAGNAAGKVLLYRLRHYDYA